MFRIMQPRGAAKCFLLLLHFTCLIQKLETILFGIQRPWKSREENLQILTMQRINFSAGHNEDMMTLALATFIKLR